MPNSTNRKRIVRPLNLPMSLHHRSPSIQVGRRLGYQDRVPTVIANLGLTASWPVVGRAKPDNVNNAATVRSFIGMRATREDGC